MIFWKREPEDLSSGTFTTPPQEATRSYSLGSKTIQWSCSPRTRSTSSSIFALLRQHSQPQSSASENIPQSLFDILLSTRHSFGIETSFSFRSYPKATHLVCDQKSISLLSAINTAELPYHSEEENSRSPTADPYHFGLILDNKVSINPEKAWDRTRLL